MRYLPLVTYSLVAGSGAYTGYAAIFTPREVSTGLVFNEEHADAFVPSIVPATTALQGFMMASAVRLAQLTVYKNGILKHQVAYSYIESSTIDISANETKYLLAGLSEIYVAAAVQYCYDHELLDPSTPAYPYLGFSRPRDLRSSNITVQNLLDHEAGYNYTSTGDPLNSSDPIYHMREVASAQGLTRAITAYDLADYMWTNSTLSSAPGAEHHNSSYGYVLLTLCVEKATGMGFLTFLNKNITNTTAQYPTNSSTPGFSSLNLAALDDDGMGLNPQLPTSQKLIPYVDGGDGIIKEVAVGSAGLAASATDLAFFIQTHAVQGHGPRSPRKSRVSTNAGTTAYAESRDDGVDWALVMNTRRFSAESLNNLIDNLNEAIDDAHLELGLLTGRKFHY